MEMKILKPFGPSILGVKMSDQLVNDINKYVDEIILDKKKSDELDHGKKYQYAHDHENNFIDMEFLPKDLKGFRFYDPGENTKEDQIRKFLKSRWRDKYGY